MDASWAASPSHQANPYESHPLDPLPRRRVVAAHSQTTLLSADFESPTWALGAAAQNGYTAPTTWTVTNAATAGFAAHGGTQFVQATGATWMYKIFASTTTGILTATEYVYIPAGTVSTRQFGFEAFNGIQGVTFASDGTVRTTNTGSSGLAAVGTVANATGRWISVGLSLNYTTKVTTATVDGASFAVAGAFSTSGTTDIDMWYAGTGTGTGYFDDYSVIANPVPEPSVLAALGLGAVALLRRRRQA